MTTIFKKIDYEDFADKIVQLEATWDICGNKRTQYSYCHIYTDTELNLTLLGDIIVKKAKSYILQTGKDYIATRKKYLSISTNLLTRVHSNEQFNNSVIFSGGHYNSQFRSIYKFGEYVPSVAFNIVIYDVKNYFINNVKSAKNMFIIDTNDIFRGEQITDLLPYSDIYNKNDRWIYNNKYHFDFQVYQSISGFSYINYSMPTKLFNDIYVSDNDVKETECHKCKQLIFGKYYIVEGIAICKFCVHFPLYFSSIIDENAIVFVGDNSLIPSDIGMNEVMNIRDFVKQDGYYCNDEYMLFDGDIIDYIFSKNKINPTVDGKTKKVILVSIIEY